MTKYREFFRRSIDQKEAFWAEQSKLIHWHKPPEKILDDSRLPFVRWFVGGQTNTCYNAVDRHLAARADQRAYVWISTEVNQSRTLTYRELHAEVNRYAAALRGMGLVAGDRVIIYLPMIAEAPVVMLATQRLGIIHSVVFGGFAPHNLAQRIDDAKPKAVITADGGMRGGKPVPYKPLVDQAIAAAKHKIEHVLYINRGLDPKMPLTPGRDVDLAALAARQQGASVDPVWVDSAHPSYILYTSGTTGAPKGVQRDTGGHAVALAASLPHIYGAKPGETYWATSDIGWAVGHSYVIYGPLLHGMTSIVYEGTPIAPDPGIWWRIVKEHKVNVMFSAPTAIRILRRQDPKYLKEADVKSLRTLFLAGEPLDAPTYHWLHENLGVPVVDHYWQTESGWPMLANCVGVEAAPIKPGSPTFPVYGWDLEVVEHGTGRRMPDGEKGVLVCKTPLPPGSLSTVWGNDERFKSSYYGQFKEMLYYTGDYAIRDADGYFFVLGRADEVINIAGHRLGTREIEEAISGHPAVAESAAVGVKDELKGQAVVAFVVLKAGIAMTAQEVDAAIKKQVDTTVGPIARPREVHVVTALPKTRSGKVIRRAITAMAEGRDPGDLSTLEDQATVDGIQQAVKQ